MGGGGSEGDAPAGSWSHGGGEARAGSRSHWSGLVGEGAATLRVRTRADGHVSGGDADLAVCALDGWHVERLRRLIAARAMGSLRAEDSALIPRHRERARAALGYLDAAIGALAGQAADELADAEMVAGSLRGALDELGEIVGRISPDAIIGRIFASFCIGK